jgi:hypothetical protein
MPGTGQGVAGWWRVHPHRVLNIGSYRTVWRSADEVRYRVVLGPEELPPRHQQALVVDPVRSQTQLRLNLRRPS